MSELPACPWCQAELLHNYVGKWRCPHCTGFFKIKKNGEVERLDTRPPSASEAIFYALAFIFVMAWFFRGC